MGQPEPREPLPISSRIIDAVTAILGHQWAFVAAVVIVVGWLAGLPRFGIEDQQYQLLINTTTTIVTFIMVFAVQHTSNRDARALHVKLDELLRVTDADDVLIGAEDETPAQLKERKAALGMERDRGTGD